MSQQFREIDCVARRCKRGARHRLLRLVKVLEVPAAHRFVVPTGGALGRNGETVVVEHLEQTRHNFLGAVLVSYRALCRAPTAGVTDGLEQQSRRARRTCRVNTLTVPPFNETRDLHWFNTIEVIPCVTVPQGCAQVDRVGRICIVGLRLVRQRTVYVFVPQSLSCDGRSGGQRGGADRRRCPVWRPLRFLADGCQAVGVSASWGRVRNTRRNLPI
jgi:hypothetical protein